MTSNARLKADAAIQDEIQEIARVVDVVQERLVNLSRCYEERDTEKLKQLEEENARLRKGVKHLGTTKAELERKLKAHKPELERAIQARDAAFKKLRHARKVIKDLMQENEEVEPNEGRVVSPTFSTLDFLSPRSSTSSSVRSSLSSNKTVRGNSSSKKVGQPPGPPKASPGQRQDGRLPSPPDDSAVVERSTSAHPGSPSRSPREGGQKWTIYLNRLPKSANICKGPYSWDDLRRIFGLKDELISSLQSLQLPWDLGMRVHALKNIAFVFDPVFLESGENSFLIDWGRREMNEGIVNHFKDSGQSEYYTFVFPKAKNGWYFIGAFTWVVVDNWLLWPTLGQKSREELVERLKDRCCEPDLSMAEELLSGGEAEQICVLMNGSNGHDHLTRQFAAHLTKALKPKRQTSGG